MPSIVSGHNGIDTVLPEQAPTFDANGTSHGVLGQGLSYDVSRPDRSVTVTGGDGRTVATLKDRADSGQLNYQSTLTPMGRLHGDGSFEIYRDKLVAMADAAKASVVSTPVDPDAGKPTVFGTPAQPSKPTTMATPVAPALPNGVSTPTAPGISTVEHGPEADGLGGPSVVEARQNSLRNQPGVVTVSQPLPPARDGWLRGTDGNAGIVPAELAQRLEGRQFANFDSFRSAFWKAAANTPEVASNFSDLNLDAMRAGQAPVAPETQWRGAQPTYILHHIQPIARGGAVYDLSNIAVVTPATHQAILDPDYHFGRRPQ